MTTTTPDRPLEPTYPQPELLHCEDCGWEGISDDADWRTMTDCACPECGVWLN
jgi:hypothetical protein